MRIGFLGYGKIGKAVAAHVVERGDEVSFVQDPFVAEAGGIPIVTEADPELLAGTDLVVECAMASVLKDNFDAIIECCDLLCFSLTAFADESFLEHAKEAAQEHGHAIFVPHGAILGLDGIADGSQIIESISITTTKSPKSLGLNPADCTEAAVVFDGSTREACGAFPRNVNVHAAVALAGIGFDKTKSRIVADPSVSTNAHIIAVKGEGIEFEIHVSSFTTGGVTGIYTPLSACGSIDRTLGGAIGLAFV
ncbi:DUF108 domain-containing protein [Coriobacteriales bacterium OH1046]|nr:DUF108 domain-containing protein [Coriobacteriales bacterium OH1046]